MNKETLVLQTYKALESKYKHVDTSKYVFKDLDFIEDKDNYRVIVSLVVYPTVANINASCFHCYRWNVILSTVGERLINISSNAYDNTIKANALQALQMRSNQLSHRLKSIDDLLNRHKI